jgi:hypothetical protein
MFEDAGYEIAFCMPCASVLILTKLTLLQQPVKLTFKQSVLHDAVFSNSLSA